MCYLISFRFLKILVRLCGMVSLVKLFMLNRCGLVVVMNGVWVVVVMFDSFFSRLMFCGW